MCNACGFLCCASDEFEGCGCICHHPGCQWEPCDCGVANCTGCADGADGPDWDLDPEEIEGMRAHRLAKQGTDR